MLCETSPRFPKIAALMSFMVAVLLIKHGFMSNTRNQWGACARASAQVQAHCRMASAHTDTVYWLMNRETQDPLISSDEVVTTF